MHEDQIEIPEPTGRALISSQFPRLAREPVHRMRTSGTDNAIFRIGEQYAARFPLRNADPASTQQALEREVAAAEELAEQCPFPAPVPVGLGAPGHGYPLHWSVQTWLPGTDASLGDASRSDALAHDLAMLIVALRAADTWGRGFSGDRRGGHLPDHDEWMEECLRRSEHLLDVPHLSRLWEHFRNLSRTAPDVMSHGDLIPANVLVTDDRLAGVLDGGGFAPADPALDVIAGWHLLDDGPRTTFRTELGCDDLDWERSKAWAFEQAMGAVWYYVDHNPAMSRMGRQTLSRIVAATPL